MNALRFFAAVGACLALAACGGFPKSSIEQGVPVTGLYFRAPETAHAWVDRVAAGPTAAHGSVNTYLPVSSGLHHVTVQAEGSVLLDQDIYVGAGSRVLVRAQ
jgi:hypothetical protein